MDRTEMMNCLAVIERTFYGQRSGITAAHAIAHIEALEAENAALRALLEGKVLCGAEPVAWMTRTEIDEDTERASFEKWSKDTFIHFTDDHGIYELADTRNAWAAWLARARVADIGKEGGE
jgi:hypothetical protein